ncbi:cell wall metabolism sensor histidine kinase WalK [Shouchella patagoniensis]|uniref:cell wall metabolism sensor histidine kinase WalK n=1 Tax=Shouchella patagoniensis TaxID=228576 RepID=UPI0009959ABE|nr:cell wall metabolism sensor histidine kinase WalK [Shouchella patagoniensis]
MERNVGFFKSIRFKLIIIYMLLIFLAMQVVSVYFSRELEQSLKDNYETVLNERLNLLSLSAAQEMETDDSTEQDLDVLVRNAFPASDDNVRYGKAQIIGRNAVVLASSSDADRSIIGQQTQHTIVKRALNGTPYQFSERFNENNQERYVVKAQPIRAEQGAGEILGAVYVEASIEKVNEQAQTINQIFITATTIALFVTFLVIIFVARTITAPILDMRRQALRMGHGDFSRQVHVYSTDELGQLAMSFNELTNKLHDTTLMRDREQKRLRSVLTHMTDGVIATDQSGLIILMNRRAEELLGISLKHVLRKSILDVLNIEDRNSIFSLYERNEPLLLDFSKGEEVMVLEAQFSAIQEDDGPINGLITVLHDVTEKEKSENERREFVANVSHELRTPLTTMKSYLEALADGAMDDKEIAPHFLGVTQNETDRMIRLVNDLLQLSKMDSQDYQLSTHWVELGSFLHSIVERFEMIVKDKNIYFHRHIVKQPTYVKIDTDKMTQVLDNIVSNAMKYSPSGGNVTVTLLHQGNKARISITDEGLGIPVESQEKIFERFYRVDKARARNVGGTGLGLAIAQEYVHAHDGDIWVHSEYNEGTTIYITLPYSTFKGGKV